MLLLMSRKAINGEAVQLTLASPFFPAPIYAFSNDLFPNRDFLTFNAFSVLRLSEASVYSPEKKFALYIRRTSCSYSKRTRCYWTGRFVNTPSSSFGNDNRAKLPSNASSLSRPGPGPDTVTQPDTVPSKEFNLRGGTSERSHSVWFSCAGKTLTCWPRPPAIQMSL